MTQISVNRTKRNKRTVTQMPDSHSSDLTSSRRLSAPHPGAAQLFCLVLLIAASASASLVFACATPFAAFAVVAAAMLRLRSAILVIAAAWLTNQIIGFGILGYPRTADAAAWGAVIGVAAVAAAVVASLVFKRWAPMGRFALYPIAFLASFAAYELALAAAIPVLGGAEDFTAVIVGRIALTNVVWLIGLVAVSEAGRLFVGTPDALRQRRA
jgi:hypothetical protein